MCPYYKAWKSMLFRAYSDDLKKRHPSYSGCSVAKEWLTFSVFKGWMEKQDWQGKHLDKDILIPGNKEYSQNSCIFVTTEINKLLNDRSAARGEFPQGVSLSNNKKSYRAACSVDGKTKCIGSFPTISIASNAYRKFKSSLVRQIAENNKSNSLLYRGLNKHALIIESGAQL